ncbi:hypothetical protein KR222_007140 [Zaprionus bogoriensis]|nr:hypothetical protein KR222_007140 [Zaprionus bogoriensis]
MREFCRSCGKLADLESAINIFSARGRHLLHSLRTITNCWVENVAGFPVYMCADCQCLLKKIKSFRKRCARIEAFLSKRKSKLRSPQAHTQPAALEQLKISDPLRIEEPELVAPNIKVEPTAEQHNQLEEQLSDECYEDQADSESYAELPMDVDVKQQAVDTTVAHDAAGSMQPAPEQGTFDAKFNELGSRKYTMRVGKRTMYIKLTDEKQPKRIVDRERQWASARPCICEHCGRQFKDSSNLNVHLLRHTGTKNYECTECNEKCYTLHLLRRHQLKHTEGPYECTFCGLQYSTNSSRVRHEREACKKGRAPQSKTDVIKRGERTFHCAICDLWFLRAGNLTQHMNSSNHIANERRKKRKFQLKEQKTLIEHAIA